MANSTEFVIDVGVKSAGIDASAAAVATLATGLDELKAASANASSQLSAATAQYKAVQAAADATAKAHERLSIAVEEQQRKVAAMAAAQDEAGYERAAAKLAALTEKRDAAASKAEAAAYALQNEAAAYDDMRFAAENAAASVDEFVSSQKAAADAAKVTAAAIQDSKAALADAVVASVAKSIEAEAKQKAAAEATMKAIRESQQGIQDAVVGNMAKSVEASKKFNEQVNGSGKSAEAAEAFGKLGGPLGKLGQKFFEAKAGYQKLQATFGDSAPYLAAASGVVAVAAVVAVLAAAAVAATFAFAAWAVKLADTARTNTLLAAGMVQSQEGGEALSATIDDLTKRFPQTREEIAGLASNLAKSGLRGRELEKAIEKAAEAGAKAKFGPEWALEMKSIAQSTKRLKAGFSGLFSGLNIERFLDSFSYLVDLFDESEVTGKVIKLLFEQMFQPGIDGAATFVDYVAAAFIQFEILVLKALLALAPYRDTFIFIGKVVETFVVGAGLGLAALAAQAAIALSMVFLWVDGFRQSIAAVSAGIDWIKSVDLSEVGANMIRGLAAGITGAASGVYDALTGAVKNAVGGTQSELKINSPSKLIYDDIGSPMIEGVSTAIVDGAPSVQGALESAVTPSSALEAVGSSIASGGPTAPAPSGGGSGAVVYLTVNHSGSDDSLVQKIADAVASVIDGAVIALEGGVPDAA